MLYREIIAVCSEIHTKHINTLCEQNVELLNDNLVVHKVYWALEGFTEIQIEPVCVARISLPQREDAREGLSSPGEPISLSEVYAGWCHTASCSLQSLGLFLSTHRQSSSHISLPSV